MQSKEIIPEEDEGPSLMNYSENKEMFPEGRFWGIREQFPEEKTREQREKPLRSSFGG